MPSVQKINSLASYQSAMQQIRTLEREVALAEKGTPRKDFPQQVQTLLALQQAIKEQSPIPFYLRSFHKNLEKTLQDLTTRVSAPSFQSRIASSPSEPAHRWPGLKIALGALIASAIALAVCQLISGQPALPNPITPQPNPTPTPPLQIPITNTVSPSSLPQITPSEAPILETQLQNFQNLESQPLFHPPRLNTQQSPFNPFGTAPVEAADPFVQALVPCLPQPLASSSPLSTYSCSSPVDERSHPHAENLVRLSFILAASKTLDHTAPLLATAAVSRLFRVFELSRVVDPLFDRIGGIEGMPALNKLRQIVDAISKIAEMLPVSLNQFLESMKSMDRLAVMGLLSILRSNTPGLQALGLPLAAIPGASFLCSSLVWSVIQIGGLALKDEYWPFAIAKGQNLIEATDLTKIETLLVHSNRTAANNQTALPTKESDLQELASIFYLLSAGYAMNGAQSIMKIAAAHELFHLAKLNKPSEALKKDMPMYISVFEGVAKMYEGYEKVAPTSLHRMLSGLMDTKPWAMAGFLKIAHNMGSRGIQRWGALNTRVFTKPVAFLAWQVVQYSPIIASSVWTMISEAFSPTSPPPNQKKIP